MMKVNIGLMGILIVIILMLVSISNLNSKNQLLYEELIIIKSLLEDLDNDIHEIEDNLDSYKTEK
tara:strand:+ start:139 stop:333 length:195 start_codon:yes stop_codon:yes gene_type:complete